MPASTLPLLLLLLLPLHADVVRIGHFIPLGGNGGWGAGLLLMEVRAEREHIYSTADDAYVISGLGMGRAVTSPGPSSTIRLGGSS